MTWKRVKDILLVPGRCYKFEAREEFLLLDVWFSPEDDQGVFTVLNAAGQRKTLYVYLNSSILVRELAPP